MYIIVDADKRGMVKDVYSWVKKRKTASGNASLNVLFSLLFKRIVLLNCSALCPTELTIQGCTSCPLVGLLMLDANWQTGLHCTVPPQ